MNVAVRYPSNFVRRVEAPYDRILPGASMLLVPATVPQRVLSIKDMVSQLRSGGLPVSTIADIAHVERKTIYSWLNGAAARDAHNDRLETIFRILSTQDLKSLYRLWNRKLDHGMSIKSLLEADPISEKAVALALHTLKPAIERYKSTEILSRKPAKARSNPFLDELPEAVLDR